MDFSLSVCFVCFFWQYWGYDIILEESILAHPLGFLELMPCLSYLRSMQRLKMVRFHLMKERSQLIWAAKLKSFLAVSDLSVFADVSTADLVFHLALWVGFEAQGFRKVSCRGALGCCDRQWGWGRCRCSLRMRNGCFSLESLFSTHIRLKRQKSTCT